MAQPASGAAPEGLPADLGPAGTTVVVPEDVWEERTLAFGHRTTSLRWRAGRVVPRREWEAYRAGFKEHPGPEANKEMPRPETK